MLQLQTGEGQGKITKKKISLPISKETLSLFQSLIQKRVEHGKGKPARTILSFPTERMFIKVCAI